MQLVNFAADYTSDDPSLNPPINESQANPMRRDTVLIPAGSAYTFRIVADNPGVWFFHCRRLARVSECCFVSDKYQLQVTSNGTWRWASRSS